MPLEVPPIHPELERILLPAFQPCSGFASTCTSMRWKPCGGHAPRGFCGAKGELEEVALVLVMAEPGDPHPEEAHLSDGTPLGMLRSTARYTERCMRTNKDQFHVNVRHILDLCFPQLAFDDQLRRAWITDSVKCSAVHEGGRVRVSSARACRLHYLERELALFPSATVVALGRKAQERMRGILGVHPAGAAAPPGANFPDTRRSWKQIPMLLQNRP